ncbi:MAG: hypothetical protein PHX16_02570 [Syntrophaceticus sp.]|nr:hypothetical protein [Syntrophaceticus sp.]MDD3315068.1 hypothetical protein [Syntrophaceticus sp.]MDD4360516.1 hypothetical protein [Syntrophaceticus sp.]MDD4782517.1 hypothetical protein [Syntrophaceticus sp.]
MAVALKDMKTRTEKKQEKNLQLAPNSKKAERIEYKFPYDDMYLLYDHITKEMKK